MIRKAVLEDITKVENIYTDLLTQEREIGGFSNWVLDVYPTRNTAEVALREGTLFVLEENGEICGSMILNNLQGDEYKKINWQYNGQEVMVIHTLCISPNMAGKGYGKAMVAFALEYGKKQGYSVMRIDTWEGNKPAASLYEKMGFSFAGKAQALLQGLIPEKQIFFEKKL